MKTISRFGEPELILRNDGSISRPHEKPSGQWQVIGAVRLNNFGKVVELFTLRDVLGSTRLQWLHKNGRQRIHIRDYDHGACRVWMSPTHEVY